MNFADAREASWGPVSGQTEQTRWVRLHPRVRSRQQRRPPEPGPGGPGGPAGDGQGLPSAATGRRVCSPPHAAVLFAGSLEGQVRARRAKKRLVTPRALMNLPLLRAQEALLQVTGDTRSRGESEKSASPSACRTLCRPVACSPPGSFVQGTCGSSWLSVTGALADRRRPPAQPLTGEEETPDVASIPTASVQNRQASSRRPGGRKSGTKVWLGPLPLRRQGDAFPPRPVSALPAAPGVPGRAKGHRPLVSPHRLSLCPDPPLHRDSSHAG